MDGWGSHRRLVGRSKRMCVGDSGQSKGMDSGAIAMSCRTETVICKHRDSARTYYVDLDEALPAGVTIVTVSASTDDASLSIDSTGVLSADTVIQNGACGDLTLKANRAILLALSGGVASVDEVIVTVSWSQSDGDSDAIDCRLFVE